MAAKKPNYPTFFVYLNRAKRRLSELPDRGVESADSDKTRCCAASDRKNPTSEKPDVG